MEKELVYCGTCPFREPCHGNDIKAGTTGDAKDCFVVKLMYGRYEINIAGTGSIQVES